MTVKEKNDMTYANAINMALDLAMNIDTKVICYGLGIDDPKRIFGTTKQLKEKYGSQRVFDMPTSENAMTGIAVGASLAGIRPVMVHQRLDFFLLAMDQLVNSASKWNYTFNGSSSVPITIRLILGRGWGQGPTHSQNLQAWFAHIPGLKVVMPTFPEDAKGLLLSSIFDDNPVLFLEHRWLHELEGPVSKGDNRIALGSANLLSEGEDLTIISMSYMTIECIHAIKYLEKINIKCDLIDLRTISPIDWDTVFKSVKKTGKVLVLDTGFKTCSVSAEIITEITKNCWNELLMAPERITMPDCPEPTSYGLTKTLYPDAELIFNKVIQILDPSEIEKIPFKNLREHHDVPGNWFKGPF